MTTEPMSPRHPEATMPDTNEVTLLDDEDIIDISAAPSRRPPPLPTRVTVS